MRSGVPMLVPPNFMMKRLFMQAKEPFYVRQTQYRVNNKETAFPTARDNHRSFAVAARQNVVRTEPGHPLGPQASGCSRLLIGGCPRSGPPGG
jgi:hypothetical protein